MVFSQETDLNKTIEQTSDNSKVGAGRGAGRLLSNGTPAKARRAKERKTGPYGLAALLDNCMGKDKRIALLRNGFVSTESITEDFRKMKAKVDGKRSALMVNEAGEVMTFPVRCRWNSEWCYGGHVGRKMLEQVRGLKKITHFILTADPKRVQEYIPDWWCYGDREFLTVAIGFMVSEFLRKLRQRKKDRGEPWNFITWVLEYHESGYVHVHLMFYGHWVAKFEELHSLWGICDYNGVRFAKRRLTDGEGICRYLTHYLSKDLQALGSEKVTERMAALMWFFRRRLYNFRHYMVNESGERVWGIPGEQFKRPVKWKRYKGEAGEVELSDGTFTYYEPTGVRIGKRIDDYLARCDGRKGLLSALQNICALQSEVN